MAKKVAMRSKRDRIRYAISFEVTLMAMLIPAGSAFFDKPLTEIGLLGIILSGKALLLHLIYNWAFDRIDARNGKVASDRSHPGRILHAIGFEVTLTLTSLPLYMWWLDVGLIDALVTDIVVTSFVVFYTYVFTLGYDRVFPVRYRQLPVMP